MRLFRFPLNPFHQSRSGRHPVHIDAAKDLLLKIFLHPSNIADGVVGIETRVRSQFCQCTETCFCFGLGFARAFQAGERHSAGKRALDAERRLDDGQSLHGVSAEALAREPSAEEAVALADVLQQVLQRFEPLQRRMIELRLQGYNLDEIAADTRRSIPTIRRVLQAVEDLGTGLLQRGDL